MASRRQKTAYRNSTTYDISCTIDNIPRRVYYLWLYHICFTEISAFLYQITYPMWTGVCFLEYQSKRTSSGLLEIVTGCTVDLFLTLFFSGVSSSVSLLHDLVTFSSSRFSLDCSHRKNKIVNTNRFRRTQAYHFERRIAHVYHPLQTLQAGSCRTQ